MFYYQKNGIALATILGLVIIGSFIYFGTLGKSPASQIKISNDVDSLPLAPQAQCQSPENTIVVKVIDGDTVVAKGGEHIRLLGIDTDEKDYPCYQEAKNRLEELVLNKEVFLQKDISEFDKYQRCLRNIFVGDKNINIELVKEGLALARFYEPDIKYKTEIINAQEWAMKNEVGCKWSK